MAYCMLVLGLCITQLTHGEARNSFSLEIAHTHLERLKMSLEDARESLTSAKLYIAETYVQARQADFEGAIVAQIEMYDILYALSESEQKSTGKSTLWEVFRVDYSAFPLVIARLVNIAADMPFDKRVELLKAQIRRCQSVEIRELLLWTFLESGRYEEANEQCRMYIENGDASAHFQSVLIKLYMSQQDRIVQEWLQEQNVIVEEWHPKLITDMALRHELEDLSEFAISASRELRAMQGYRFALLCQTFANSVNSGYPGAGNILTFLEEELEQLNRVASLKDEQEDLSLLQEKLENMRQALLEYE